MMNRFIFAGVIALLLCGPTQAYEATAEVTFNWATSGVENGWSFQSANSLSELTDGTYFTSLSGQNFEAYFNADFATPDWFANTANCVPGFEAQYACKTALPPNDVFPVSGVGPGAAASGSLAITDTTLTGTLQVLATSDVGAGPQPGTSDATGYNIRTADQSPFKNVWYGISTAMTLNVNLTGSFSASSWNITGGTVRFEDPAFQCAFADFSGTLCGIFGNMGAVGIMGENRSWGVDPDGGQSGTAMTEIPVLDANTLQIIESLSGVLADITIDGSGNLTTVQGEYRRALGNSLSGCPFDIRYDGSSLSCGTLTVGDLAISGVATTVPLPAATWLFGSALGLLGWIGRTRSAALRS